MSDNEPRAARGRRPSGVLPPVRMRATVTVEVDAKDPTDAMDLQARIQRAYQAFSAIYEGGDLRFSQRKPRRLVKRSASNRPKIVYAEDD